MSLYADIDKQMGSFRLRVTLEVQDEILGLFGASGSGKSMTLKCIAGIITPDQGKIIVNGRVLFDSEQKINLPVRKRKIGLMFQNYALFPNMTVAQNIEIGIADTQKREESVRSYVKLMRLEGLENRFPTQLSGGQQQRVALARMMASEPDLLMLDEPFSALDEQLRREIEPEFATALSKFQGTVVYVSHSISEVYRYCNSTAIIRDGLILEQADTKTLFSNPKKVESARLLCCKNIASVSVKQETAFIPDWGISLHVPNQGQRIPQYIGIHSDDLVITDIQRENTVSAKIGKILERPRYAVVYLYPKNANKPLILSCDKKQAEQLKQKTDNMILLHFPKEKLLLLND